MHSKHPNPLQVNTKKPSIASMKNPILMYIMIMSFKITYWRCCRLKHFYEI